MSAPVSAVLPPPAPVRPSLVTLVAIVDLVFGGWDLLGAVFTMFMPAMMGFFARMMERLPTPPGARNPAAQMQAMLLVYSRPWIRAWLLGAGALHLFVGMALLAAGIGLLRMEPWGRTAAFATSAVYGVLALAGVVVGVVISLQIASIQPAMGGPSNSGGVVGGVFGALFGLFFAVVLPAANFLVLLRADTRAAFDRPQHAALAKTFE